MCDLERRSARSMRSREFENSTILKKIPRRGSGPNSRLIEWAGWAVPSPAQAATIELAGDVVQCSLARWSSRPVPLRPAAARR